MTIFSVWIFDRHCNCIFSREYSPLDPQHTSTVAAATNTNGTVNSKDNEDTAKLLFGALFSLRNIARTLGDKTPAPHDGQSFNNSLKTFTTGKYRAHFHETLSNLRFCVLSDLGTRDLQGVLTELKELYLNWVVRNPLAQVEFDAGEYVSDPGFVRSVDEVLVKC